MHVNGGRWRTLRKVAVIAFYIAVAVLCVLSIRSSLGPSGFRGIPGAFLSLAPWALALSGTTAIGVFSALVAIERLSLRDVTSRPAPRFILTPFVVTTLSLGAGFGPVSGSALRLRLYARYGVGPTGAVYLATTTTLSLLSGGIVLAATGAAVGVLHLDASVAPATPYLQAMGVALLLGLAVIIVAAGRRGRAMTVLKRTLYLPSSGALFLRVMLATFNWTFTAAGLYVLLPEAGRASLPDFVATVSALKLASLMTGAPGGLGVFEALVLSLEGGSISPDDLTAALIANRILSFVIPVVLAGVGAAFLEARGDRPRRADVGPGPDT